MTAASLMANICHQQIYPSTENLCRQKIDTGSVALKDWTMQAKLKKAYRKLYVGEWLARLDRTQADVAEATGIGAPYLNQLISGDKQNPSADKLLRISEEIGIPMNDLYKPPPKANALDELRNYSPDVINRLIGHSKTAQ